MAHEPAGLSAPAAPVAAVGASQPGPSGTRPSAKRRFNFLDLPLETQNQIIYHCAQPELVCLSVVSRHFRDLAARQLYRNFHIVFPDEEDPAFESPIDSLAGGLDTFVTSDYDYSAHLRQISLDTLIAGPKSEKAYRPYLFKNSCGKFMNTLLLLTLKRARCLEAFRWNIRVELSRPVYRALHSIESIKKIHIRMQAGRSLYEPVPSLPYTTQPHAPAPLSIWHDENTDETNTWAPPAQSYVMVPGGLHAQPVFKPPPRTKTAKRHAPAKEPPTFSGFKNLRSLSVMDIDSLDVISEVRACVKSSTTTLRKLRLSFSDSLAAQARRPPPESESDESDADDEFQIPPPPQPLYDGGGPAKQFKAQEERKRQETILGKIFDIGLSSSTVKQPTPRPLPPPPNADPKPQDAAESEATGGDNEQPEKAYLGAMRTVANTLTERCRGSSSMTDEQRKEILDIILTASRLYVGTRGSKKDKAAGEESATGDGDAATPAPATAPAPVQTRTAAQKEDDGFGIDMAHPDSDNDGDFESVDGDAEEDKENTEQPHEEGDETVQPDTTEEAGKADDTPDKTTGNASEKAAELGDDVTDEPDSQQTTAALPAEEPAKSMAGPSVEGADAGLQQAPTPTMEQAPTPTMEQSNAPTAIGVDTPLVPETPQDTAEGSIFRDAPESVRSPKGKERATSVTQGEASDGKPEPSSSKAMRDYLFQSHGLALREFAVYLIPIRTSVLSRSLDLYVLEKVTLLNVGNQIPFWSHMTKENRTKPLRLRRIFTDHVTPTFLQCVSQLEKVDELLLLERSTKYKPESLAPKVPTTIDQIRRLALKKHMHTLKRLMIKDSSAELGWDINAKTILLICNRGVKLEELAVSLGVHTIHGFIQHMTGLVKLRALHIIHFRNSDTCIWVMRETLRFIVDSVAHNPHLKLEWIAIADERVDRIMRPDEFEEDDEETAARKKAKKEKKEKEKKNKALAALALGGAATADASNDLPILPVDGWDYSDSGSDDDDDDDDDEYDADSKLKLKTMTGVQFFDVWGVKLFSKEVRAGRI